MAPSHAAVSSKFSSHLNYMGYLSELNVKDATMSSSGAVNDLHDGSVKKMYSCGHQCKNASTASNVLGVVIIIAVISFVVYRYLNKPLSAQSVLGFMAQQDVFKMLIGLLMLTNIKTLSNSLIANIILPIIQPVLPLVSCNLKIKFGLFEICVGEFISDILIFGINIYIIYFLFAIMY